MPTLLTDLEQQRVGDAMEAAEEERRRWARTLHDDTLQALGALHMLLAAARRSRDPERLRAAVDEAVARIETGLKAPAPTADFLILAARTYGAARQPQKAEELLKRAIEVAPGRMGAYEVLGQFYVGQQRLDEAGKQYQQLVERNPTSVSANTMLGMIYEAQRHLSEAETQYQKVMALDPGAAVQHLLARTIGLLPPVVSRRQPRDDHRP